MHGASLDVHVQSPSYEGLTVPPFIQHLTHHTPDFARLTKFVDVSAVLSSPTEIRVAVVNRSETDPFSIYFAFGPNAEVENIIRVHEVWSENLDDTNEFGKGGDKVKAVEREEHWDTMGGYVLKSHSFQSESLVCCYNDGI
jgi:alpha-L-arabinofuranosidase